MIKINEWMELVNYKITESSYYGWTCYGPNAYYFESWSGTQDGYSVTITFDTKDHTTYELAVHDLKRNKAYRMLNKSTQQVFKEECARKNLSFSEAWDDIEYVDLEVVDDFLEKTKAIMAGEEYDTRVDFELRLPDNELLALMKLAHERDQTFNEFVEQVVEEFCNKELQKLKE